MNRKKTGCGKTFFQREQQDSRLMMEVCPCTGGSKLANEADIDRNMLTYMNINKIDN